MDITILGYPTQNYINMDVNILFLLCITVITEINLVNA